MSNNTHTQTWGILSLASGDYLPERYASRDEVNHAIVTRFGCRSGAYKPVRFKWAMPED